ncbi:MAG TPA: type III secretion system export apparatus subunit SctU [Ramlibacter sp.]|jgi:type III secretion protein U|uniref:type III secretion system export apparatus subunit SctU n=1 Tax=Ramlibacter sp. TaxID=1917967 RepID=UPI002D2D97E7|nr:type III secretion system export apparatus subunit SctU [Ramlibacter sp.]HZY20521.1 type III secretion system export apparatus subunit SctU [Ramlibacter sp.]
MSEKTEQPTAKKIREARKEGQVAHSKDFTQTLLILAIFGYMLADAQDIVRRLGQMIVLPAGMLTMEFGDALDALVSQLLHEAIALMLPFLLIIIGLGLFAEMLQTGMLFSFKALMPSAKKLNVVTNLKNIVSAKNLVEFLKNILKIGLLSAIVYAVLRESLPTLMTLPQAGVVGVGVALAMLLKALIVRISVGYAVIAAADFAWQRYQYTKGLMMSKEEVKQEYKEAEGDPHIKHQRKHIHQEMLQEGAVQKTRQASVVITNPTHLAIAVRYEQGETPLPVVLAKAEGAVAERMVRAAREEGIPVLQNIPLARALMATAEPDQYIPSELLEGVAEVLRMVQQMKRED